MIARIISRYRMIGPFRGSLHLHTYRVSTAASNHHQASPTLVENAGAGALNSNSISPIVFTCSSYGDKSTKLRGLRLTPSPISIEFCNYLCELQIALFTHPSNLKEANTED